MSCGCDNKKIETQYLGDVPIDTFTSLPENLLAERVTKDEMSGDSIHTLVRIPTKRIVPNGTLDNVFTVVANNDVLTIPEGQVKAGVITQVGSTYSVVYADENHPAQFLILAVNDDVVQAQNCGIINLLSGHDYVLLQQYYQGENGIPTTDSASGVKLFVPISKTQLLVDL